MGKPEEAEEGQNRAKRAKLKCLEPPKSYSKIREYANGHQEKVWIHLQHEEDSRTAEMVKKSGFDQ